MGSTLYQAEVDFLRRHEWAMTAEDVLSRRTKLMLALSVQEQEKVRDLIGT